HPTEWNNGCQWPDHRHRDIDQRGDCGDPSNRYDGQPGDHGDRHGDVRSRNGGEVGDHDAAGGRSVGNGADDAAGGRDPRLGREYGDDVDGGGDGNDPVGNGRNAGR
ncbi:MAG: hypothetical protein ACK559_30285, partial [bacterium]